MTRADFDACLTNQELFEGVQASRARAQSEFGVSSTPTFFVNGNMVRGAVSIDEFENQMEPFLEG
ncbi:MAG: thioredoxin domain-containing protein [Pseudomonadota bacterium]